MRKVMILASMLAMVMLAASPALAQTQSSEQNASGTNINQLSQQCQNIIGDINVEGGDNIAAVDQDATASGGDGGDASADQYQYGTVEGGDGGDAAAVNVAEVAQENNTTVTVVQNCFQAAAQANVNIEDVEAPQAPADDQYVAPEDDDAPADDQYVAPEDDDAPAGDVNGDGVVDDDDAAAAAGAGAAAPAGDDAAVAPAEADDAEGGAVAVLPDTGGASLFTLGAGALLVAGGLLARRIIR